LGRGGIKAVAEATGAHPDTVTRGVRELEGDPEPAVRVRASGGGRRKLSQSDPKLMARLKALVDPETRVDPMSLLVWTTKSTRNLAGALTAMGHPVSDRTVARMLASLGFSLQGNAKTAEGNQHGDRDAQFRYLAAQVAEHAGAGQAVVSVDAKKKELAGIADKVKAGHEIEAAEMYGKAMGVGIGEAKLAVDSLRDSTGVV
jgi:transposase